MVLFEQQLKPLFQAGGETHPSVLGFIVLSGYCIHRAGLRTGREDIGRYAQRRFWRIFPVYLVASIFGAAAITVAAMISTKALGMAGGEANGWCLAAKLVGLPAWAPTLFKCSFAGNAPLNTVTAEIGLYALYPALLLGVGSRFGERGIWLVVAAVWSLGTAMVTAIPAAAPWWHNGSTLGFLAYWWIGAKMLDPAFTASVRKALSPIILGWLSLTLLLMIGQWAGTPVLVEMRKLLFCLLVGVVIASIDRSGQPGGVLSWVGQRGYSLYAFHAPVLYLLLVSGVPWWLAVAAAVAAGLVAYRYIEAPALTLGKDYRSKAA